MKAVAMMKKAIKDSNLNGYKWTATKDGLAWEYGVNFIFTYEDNVVTFEDRRSGVKAVVCIETNEKLQWLCDETHDFVKTADEAVYWAARKMIRVANKLY